MSTDSFLELLETLQHWTKNRVLLWNVSKKSDDFIMIVSGISKEIFDTTEAISMSFIFEKIVFESNEYVCSKNNFVEKISIQICDNICFLDTNITDTQIFNQVKNFIQRVSNDVLSYKEVEEKRYLNLVKMSDYFNSKIKQRNSGYDFPKHRCISDKPIIYEDIYYKEMWNYIVEEIKKLKYDKEMKFGYFSTLQFYCYRKLNYKGNILATLCFACEYAKQFKYENTKCINCPFEGINLKQGCLNGIYNNIIINYNRLISAQSLQEFNALKEWCIELAIKIRDWPIKEGVLCRSQIAYVIKVM